MFDGLFAILDRELRATVEASEAHHAALLHPFGPFVDHLDGVHRAFSGA